MSAAVAEDLNLGFTAEGDDLFVVNIANVVWLGIVGALLLYSVGRDREGGFRTRLRPHDWVYVGWLCFLGASARWSISAGATFRTLAPLVVVWLAALLLCRTPSWLVVRAVVLVAVVTAVLSLAMPALSTDLAFQPSSSTGSAELRGVFRHQLRLGAFMSLAVGLLVIAWLRRDLGRVGLRSNVARGAVILLFVVVVVLSRARTYSAAAVLALVLALLISRRGFRKWLFLSVVGVAAVLVVQRWEVLWNTLQESEFDTTLTGRLQVWDRTLSGVTQSSRWLGHGLGTLQLPDFDHLFPWHYRSYHAHNSYLQAYFETGVVGLALLIGLVAVQLVAAWRSSVRTDRYSYSLFLVLYTAIASLTGLNYAGPLSALFSLMMLMLAIESREARSREASRDADPDGRTPSLDLRSP